MKSRYKQELLSRKRQEMVVVNLTERTFYRAGYEFPPKQETTVSVLPSEVAEIKACRALNVFHKGIPCDFPGCDFVAKSDRALYAHKRKHKKKGGAKWDDAEPEEV